MGSFLPAKNWRGGWSRGMAPDTFYREKHRAQSVSEGKITEGRFVAQENCCFCRRKPSYCSQKKTLVV